MDREQGRAPRINGKDEAALPIIVLFILRQIV